MAAPPP